MGSLDGFAELTHFPGSSRPRVLHTNRAPQTRTRPAPDTERWDAHPRIYSLGGVEMEFFTVGQLAAALGRKSPTVRRWEREGILPKATYQVPSDDPRGRRRLYSRAQVEGIVVIAAEEGILTDLTSIPPAFRVRVLALFKDLANPDRSSS